MGGGGGGGVGGGSCGKIALSTTCVLLPPRLCSTEREMVAREHIENHRRIEYSAFVTSTQTKRLAILVREAVFQPQVKGFHPCFLNS